MQAKAVSRDRWQGWFTWRFHRHPGICSRDEWPRDLVIYQWWLWQPVMSMGCQSQQCSVPFNNNLHARFSCWHQWVLCKVLKSLRLHIECEWWMLSYNVSFTRGCSQLLLGFIQRSRCVDMYKRKAIQIDTWKADFIPPLLTVTIGLVQTYKTPTTHPYPQLVLRRLRRLKHWRDPYLPGCLWRILSLQEHRKILYM